VREWRAPFGQPPEVVFVVLHPELSTFDEHGLLSWLDSALPLLNWRTHMFVVGGEDGDASRVAEALMSRAGKYLDHHGFSNIHIHSLLQLRPGAGSQPRVWGRLVAAIKPFQLQAQELSSEARLHLAPILAPSPGVSLADALRAAEFFRSRMAIPSFWLAGGSLQGLVQMTESESTRFFVDDESLGLPILLWRSHVFETVLDRLEEDADDLISPCRSHLVIDAQQGRVFSCFKLWKQCEQGTELLTSNEGPPSLPPPPNSDACLSCIAESVVAMRDSLMANHREAEGRKVCFRLGIELAGSGNLPLAADLAHLAFELSTSNEDKATALIHEALCLRDSGRLEQADQMLEMAGEFTEDQGQIAYQRGRVQFVWRDYIEALDWFEAALESPSDQVPVEDMCFEMALCHINIEEYPEARPYLDRSQKSDERKAPVAFYRGVCDFGEGKFETALSAFREALEFRPAAEDLGRILYYIGACLKEMEQYEEAVSVLREAVTADPEDLANHNLLGFCYYKLKRHEEAVACFLRAVEINPNSGIDWANLGSNLRDLGKTKEAIAMYKKALSLDPHIGFARDNLKRLSE
jgi:tetratricopeptide (TPR) repeat protein